MFELKVGGLIDARYLIARGWPTKVVRLLPWRQFESDVPIVEEWHLQIDVDDINKVVLTEQILPDDQHLQTVLKFTESLTDDDRLLIHCYAGISRSTAIAIAICIQHGMSWRDAYHHVESVRDILKPNLTFIRLIDDHFKLDGALLEYVTYQNKLHY